MFLAIELCLTVSCVALAYIRPGLADSWFSRIEQNFAILAERRALAVISVGLLALGVRLALLPILPIPEPGIHDEYSHLLLADTLAHGRLANPTHPMWVHFETFHVNWKPSYASMYFPGHALFLALGQAMFGHPFWGVWLSAGLMCAAICWALQGWLPPSWALLGGLLAVIRLGTFSYWANSYWGGAVAAFGGALVLGALPRIKRDQRIRDALLLGIGTALLVATRPYESLFFLFPIAAAVVVWILRDKSVPMRSSLIFMRVVFPAGLVVLLSMSALAYYFWRVTGSPWNTPYKTNMATYGLVYFPWDKIQPISYRHAALHNFYRGGAVLGMYHFARQHPIELLLTKALMIWLFYFGPVLTLPLIAWMATRGAWQVSREAKFLLVMCATTFLGLALIVHVGHPHYLAPLTAAFYALVLLSMRSVRHWKWGNRASGMFLVRMVPVICVLMFLVRTAAPLAHASIEYGGIRTWCSENHQNLERARILNQLEHSPGEHLVVVRYGPDHDFILNEWVFNNADIDASKVILARDMGAQNSELLQYFSRRKAWLLEPDYNPPRLSHYVQ